jgi:hypothetical protein
VLPSVHGIPSDFLSLFDLLLACVAVLLVDLALWPFAKLGMLNIDSVNRNTANFFIVIAPPERDNFTPQHLPSQPGK